jgi:predicted metal-dependent HD superfamily phosphohydrolase
MINNTKTIINILNISFGYKEKSSNEEMLFLAITDCLNSFYSQSHRYYHNTNHILDLYYKYENYEQQYLKSQILSDTELHIVMVLSILFHDVVYNTQFIPRENELLSAKMARDFIDNPILRNFLLNKFEIDFNKIALIKHYVSNIIMSTVKHSCDENFIEPNVVNFFIDLDLSILGDCPEKYEEYSENIRKEYSFVPDDVFCQGRLNIVDNFLKKVNNKDLFKIINSEELNYVAKFNLITEQNKLKSV